MSTYVAQKRVDQSISAANAQIAKSPNNSGFYDLLGTAFFYNKKDLAGAAAAFQKATELDKNNSDAQFKLVQVQAAKGSTDAAIATCRQALTNNPNEPGFYILLGDLYQAKRDWNSATEAYQKALAISPENPLASNDLASVMLQSGGNLDVALSLAQTARRGMPQSQPSQTRWDGSTIKRAPITQPSILCGRRCDCRSRTVLRTIRSSTITLGWRMRRAGSQR
jgi:cytochrome c-type biogenesis protein CcmH/NrfG